MKLLFALLALVSMAGISHAQCANGQCFQPSYGSGYSTGFYGGFTFAEPYSAPVVVTETRPVFTTSIVNGQHRAVNNMTGAVWTWNPYTQAWRYDGNRNQPVIVEQRVYAPSPYQTSQRCQCGCGCLNCRCGR